MWFRLPQKFWVLQILSMFLKISTVIFSRNFYSDLNKFSLFKFLPFYQIFIIPKSLFLIISKMLLKNPYNLKISKIYLCLLSFLSFLSLNLFLLFIFLTFSFFIFFFFLSFYLFLLFIFCFFYLFLLFIFLSFFLAFLSLTFFYIE